MVRVFFTAAAFATATHAASAAVSQVHLGLSSANVNCANGMAVSFASELAQPYTVSLTSTKGASKSAKSTWTSYSVNEPKFNYTYSSPMLHTALLCDLEGNTQYSYAIGDNKEFTGSFVSPPHAGADDIETVVGVVGDPGDTTNSETTLSELAKPYQGKRVQAVLIAGDYSYANGDHRQWDNWMQEQQNLTSVYPISGTSGNHETITSSGHLNLPPYPADSTKEAENYLGYLQRIYTPITAEARAALRTWFSLDIGLIHFVFIDDYTGSHGTDSSVVGTPAWLAEREAQLAWVKSDLAAVDRATTPWVIVIKHNPYYNTWSNHQCQCSPTIFDIADADAANCWNGKYFSGNAYSEPHCGLQAKLEDLYAQYKVNVVMAGHVHGYERTAKIYKNKVDTVKGTYYVTTGAGGNYEGHAGPRLSNDKVPSWALGANNVFYGASRVIATRKSLRAVWFANDFLNEKEAIATDGFTIYADGNDDLNWPPVDKTPAPSPSSSSPAPTSSSPAPKSSSPAPTSSGPAPTSSSHAPTPSVPVTPTSTPTPVPTTTKATPPVTSTAAPTPAPTRLSC